MDTTLWHRAGPSVEVPSDVVIPPASHRVMLWIDGVGGYLVCLDEVVSLGQAVADTQVHVPIVADLSRQHATILREGEGYVLVPQAALRVDGRPVRGPTLLVDGDVLQLGDCVELRFRQPHPLSQSARLDLVSSHRPDPSADGVLLMADTCILGAGPQSHVVCRGWSQQVVLLRTPSGLGCRCRGPVEIDGRQATGRIELTERSRICGLDFCFSLEPLR